MGIVFILKEYMIGGVFETPQPHPFYLEHHSLLKKILEICSFLKHRLHF